MYHYVLLTYKTATAKTLNGEEKNPLISIKKQCDSLSVHIDADTEIFEARN